MDSARLETFCALESIKMRDVFGVISMVIQNLQITRGDIEYDNKPKILRLTPEKQDIKIIAHDSSDGTGATFRSNHRKNNNSD